MESTNAQQKQREYEIVLPNELIRLVAFAMPEEDVRMEKNISKTLDNYIGERRKAALAAEIANRMKGKESGLLDQIKFDMLLKASISGYVWRVRHLLTRGGVKADWLRENKDRLLHQVVDQGNASVPIVKLLLDHGVPVDGREENDDYCGATALLIAAGHNNLAVCKLLVNNGADPNAENYRRYRPLHRAACNGFADIVCLLLKNGATLDAVDKDGETCLHVAMLLHPHMHVAKIILDYAEENGGLKAKKALMDARDEDGMTALHRAYYYDELDMAKLLEEQGADKDMMDNEGKKPYELKE